MTPAQARAVRHAEDHGGAALHCSRCLWSGVVKTIEFGTLVSAESAAGMPLGMLRCPQCGTDCDLLHRSAEEALA